MSTAVESPAPTATTSTPEDEYKDVVLPPPEIRAIVDKTAAFVSKSPNPETFEEKIRAREKSDSRFAFLNKTDAYHTYYQRRLDAFRKGAVLETKEAAKAEGGKPVDDQSKEDQGPPQPPPLEFLVDDPPTMNAVDLDILRLTALFTARSGRRFASDLAAREARNYQFDFLRPSHSLFGYFNRLVEQYTKILIPSKEFTASLERHAGGPATQPDDERLIVARTAIKHDAEQRVEWEKWDRSRRQEQEDRDEAERVAFAQIDWKDFVVASTVEFTEGDEEGITELPPPMSLSEVENMTLAQKKMASMIMEGREDEVTAMQAEGDHSKGGEAEMDMDDASDDDDAAQAQTVDKERLKVVEIIPADSSGPMKIRKDYVPKAKREKKTEQAVTTFAGQQVPVDEFADHVRYELLDPKWRETKRKNEQNRSAANLLPEGTDVSASLRALATHRSDIFGAADDDEIKRQQEALKAQSKAREAEVWDGHTASKESIQNRYQASANFDEQIEALHRAKGLIGEDGADPKIGPSAPIAVAPVEAPSPFMVGAGGAGATFSAAPQPNATTMYPPATMYGYNQYPTMGYGLPARPAVANPGDALPGSTLGQTRPAEGEPEDEPDAKRPKMPKLADGQYYPEEEWIEAHPDPVTINVVLPEYPAKPEWGCDGSTVELSEVPLTLLVGTLRDRISIKTGLPIGKQKLTFRGRPLANNATLGGLNFEDGDTVTIEIKEARKK